jgi:autotransporter-associated beta strand protein
LSLNGAGGTAVTNIVLVNHKCVATDAAGSWSLGYWIKTSTAGAVIMYQGDGGWSSSGQTTFYLNNNGTTAGTHAGGVRWAGGWLTGTAALNNNAWHFVTLVDNAGTETIYVDGNVDAVTSTMGNPLATGANQMWIGGTPDGGDGGVKMNGLIDEVWMFSRALSQAEIQSLYINNAITNASLNTLPVATTVTVATSGVLDLAGVSQNVAGLSGGGSVTNSGSAATLTVSNASGASLFSGKISDASAGNAVSFTKNGGGTEIFAGANNYRGATTVNGGTLKLSPVADDSILHLTFNNAAGSGNGSVITNTGLGGATMNGTLVTSGGASIVSGGRFGNALSLNGAGGTAATNIVLITNKCVTTDASSSWSVGYWIKTSTAGAEIMYQGDSTWSSSGQTMFYLNNNGTTSGTKAGAVRWAGGWLTGTAALNNNAWHFVTLVDNAGTETIYVDGNVDAVTSAMANPLASGANQIWIGSSPDSGDGAARMVGLIDEVWMFSRALSQTEVQSLYGSNTLTTNGSNVLPATTPVSVAAGATFDLGGVSQTIAALTGSGAVTNTGSATTLTISNTTGTTTFSGSIGDTAAGNALSLIKSGGATNVFSGANTYRGTTTINNGMLFVNGSLGTGAVMVTYGGALGGNGAIGGAVTIQSGGTLAPGTGSIGQLAIGNVLTLASGSTTQIKISKSGSGLTNDSITGLTSIACDGTLIVTNLGTTALAAGDTFQIFSAASYGGAFASATLPALAGNLIWTNRLAIDGTLAVVNPVSTVPTNLVWSVSGTNLNLSWPADHSGWRLLVQTNNLLNGISANSNDWMTIPGSALTNQMVVPLDATLPLDFYRLVYP